MAPRKGSTCPARQGLWPALQLDHHPEDRPLGVTRDYSSTPAKSGDIGRPYSISSSARVRQIAQSALSAKRKRRKLTRADRWRVRLRFWKIVLACGAALALQVPAKAAHADACKNLLGQFKSAVDRANREVATTVKNLQESASQVPNDKRRIALIAQSCAASAEAAGVLKSYRIVIAECMGDRDRAQSDFLQELDRSISQIRVALDKACR